MINFVYLIKKLTSSGETNAACERYDYLAECYKPPPPPPCSETCSKAAAAEQCPREVL